MRDGDAVEYTPLKTSMSNEPEDAGDEGLTPPTKIKSAVHEKKKDYERLVLEAEEHHVYASIIQNATEPEDIPSDTWGAMVFLVVVDLPDLRAGRAVMEGKVRTLYILLLFIVNIFIQGVLIFFIARLLLLPDMLNTQDVYKTFHNRAFSQGVLDEDGFWSMSGSEKKQLCGMALSQHLFVRVILFLWVTTNVAELRDNFAKCAGTVELPRLPEELDTRLMVRDLSQTTGGGEFCIVCLNKSGKVGLFLLVFIPKFIIAIFMTFIGSVWLTTARSIGDLILNSLALAFVVKVDELMAVVFFPQRLQHDVATLTLMLPANPEEKDEDIRSRNNTWAYFGCAMIVIGSAALVEVLINFQPVIPNYGTDVAIPCVAYLNKQVPWCLPWQTDCFPTS